jgi:hypothetical protein
MNLKNNREKKKDQSIRRGKEIPDAHSIPDCKHMSIVVTHRTILGETSQYNMCVVFLVGLPGGPIILEGFVGNLFRSELGSAQE